MANVFKPLACDRNSERVLCERYGQVGLVGRGRHRRSLGQHRGGYLITLTGRVRDANAHAIRGVVVDAELQRRQIGTVEVATAH